MSIARGTRSAGARAEAQTDVEVVQTSADLSQRLTRLPELQFTATSPARGARVIGVNDRIRYQRIGGFGAAMTDTSAWLLDRELGRYPATRAALFGALFGAGGIDLGFLRVPIGASDFTHDGKPYTYDDLPRGRSDRTLSHFSIAHDESYVLPALHQALAIDHGIQILATPWSPPAWMKTNDSLDNVRHRGKLAPSAARPWAQYIVKFVQAYARAGVPIAAITPQNEPTNPTTYPGLELPESSEAKWLAHDLEPALGAARLHPEIYGNDYGWGPRGTAYAKALASGAAARTLNGIAWHCYFGTPAQMSEMHREAPRLDEIVDECSPGIIPFPISEAVIGSVRNWAGTVALWNLALDPHGGPVQPPNGGCHSCTALASVDERTGAISLGLNYFQLGQASAFVRPGALRIESNHFVSYRYKRPGANLVTSGLDDVAFLNPDGSRVLLAYDNSSSAISFAVQWRGQSLTYTLAAKAMVTLKWRGEG
ncbi:MAG: glucosylceramidase [Actinomycetota bacterium]|nr:glucosylceramidase [Actinomycetota bacterium]